MAINWHQVGEDFRQKYEGTFCRYISPVTKRREVFKVTAVTPDEDRGPDITLFNQRAGEIYLGYETEAELDFEFPETRYFLHIDKALLFERSYQRQWKKGLCSTTAIVDFPYNALWGGWFDRLNEEMVNNAFSWREIVSPQEAARRINDGLFSIPLNKSMAMGRGKMKGEFYLWFHNQPIGTVNNDGKTIRLRVHSFRQEVSDYLRSIGDYGTTTIQAI